MTAIYKKIYTKPSLNDVWHVESDVYQSQTQFSNYCQIASNMLASSTSGFVSFKTVEPITTEELESRKYELKEFRPDLYNLFFKNIVENYVDLSKPIFTVAINPFNNIHTEIYEYDTWENLIFAYETYVTKEMVIVEGSYLKKCNNTLIEEFYLNDIKQNYIGNYTKWNLIY